MIINNRHKKPYSEKLFNELCILFMVMDNNNALDNYVLYKRINASKRSIYRYIEELNAACPFLNLHFEGKTKLKYLCADLPEDYESFCLSNFIVDSMQDKDWDNNRLSRCSLLLAHNHYSLLPEDEIDDDELDDLTDEDFVIIGDERFAFVDFFPCPELYKKTSLRTQQRDVRLVKDILIKMTHSST